MLPNRNSGPAPRRPQVIAVEARLPGDGSWFAAVAVSLHTDGLVLSTFRELSAGTELILELALPDGALTIDGVVAEHEGPGMRVALSTLDGEARERIDAYAGPSSERPEEPEELASRVA